MDDFQAELPSTLEKKHISFDGKWHEFVLDQRLAGRRDFSFVEECDLVQLCESIKAMRKDQESIVF